MFSVHDSKAEAFVQPFFAPNTAVGLRIFQQNVNDPNTTINSFPEDYTLFELGEFNSDTGMVTYHDSPKSLALALTLIKKETSE